MPYSGTERWIFNIKKRSNRVKTIRLSIHIDIFDEKKFSKFLFGAGGQKVSFLFNTIEKNDTHNFKNRKGSTVAPRYSVQVIYEN